jgi:ubiquinone/menaquinone biosynthesis C-methylase UbiE
MNKIEYQIMYEIEETHWWYKGMRKISDTWLKKYLSKDLAKGCELKILDAGCGTGFNLIHLSKFGKTQGIDYSIDAVEFCRKRNQIITHDSIQKMPFPNQSFDLLTCIDVLYHRWVTDDVAVLKEFNRVLAKDGLLFIRVAAFNSLLSEHDKAMHVRERYTKTKLKERLEMAGFKVEKISYCNFFLFPIAYLMRKIKTLIINAETDKATSDNKPLSAPLNYCLMKILFLEAYLLKIMSFPFGISLICIAKPKETETL